MPRKRRDIPWLDERNGVYYACWYDESRRRTERLSLHTRQNSEAKARFAAFLLEGKSLHDGQKKTGLTVAEALTYWQKEHADVKLVSAKELKARLKHLVKFMGHRMVQEVNVPLCRSYVDHRRADDATSGTIRFELSRLQSAAKHCVLFEHMSPADLPKIELPAPNDPRDRWLTKDELAKIRDAADQVTRDFIDLCYYTGSRRTAIETLTWFQVDLTRGRISLAKPGERKTSKRRPVVPIDPLLLPVLQRLNETKDNGERVLPVGPAYYVRLQTACKAAGVAPISPHVLRHTRATHLLQDGVDIWAVAGLLGDDVATVEKSYGHHCPNYLGEAISRSKA